MPSLAKEILEENINFWEQRYGQNNIGWHIEEVHPNLVKYIDLLATSANSNQRVQSKKFFVPLCGKTKDIPYLLSLGHEVFGVEAVRSAIEQLDEENGLGLKYDENESLFYTEDLRLKIYCGDFLSCQIEKWGPFDCVWDRGSFCALDYCFRKDYIEVMKRSVGFGTSHPFKYLLVVVRYDRNFFEGPPRAVDENDVKQFFESWMDVKELDKLAIPSDHPMRKVSGDLEADFFELTFFAKPKTNN